MVMSRSGYLNYMLYDVYSYLYVLDFVHLTFLTCFGHRRFS